jgi:hypothetical protein
MYVGVCFLSLTKLLVFAVNCILKIVWVNRVLDWPVDTTECLIMDGSDTETTSITVFARLYYFVHGYAVKAMAATICLVWLLISICYALYVLCTIEVFVCVINLRQYILL